MLTLNPASLIDASIPYTENKINPMQGNNMTSSLQSALFTMSATSTHSSQPYSLNCPDCMFNVYVSPMHFSPFLNHCPKCRSKPKLEKEYVDIFCLDSFFHLSFAQHEEIYRAQGLESDMHELLLYDIEIYNSLDQKETTCINKNIAQYLAKSQFTLTQAPCVIH
jgi:hypothetical protein